MKIALVWPKSTFLIDPMYYPPLGLWYVWSALLKAGAEADFLDLDEDTLDPAQYDQVWVSGTTPQAAELRRLGDFIRSSGTKAVLGGPHAWLKSDNARHYYDLVVWGEVLTREDAVKVIRGHSLLDLGLGDISKALPHRAVAWRYHATLQGRRCTTAMTSLGCPYHCAFCSSQDLWGGVRYVDLDTVRKDLRVIAKQGFRAVQFYDDILPIKRKRALAIGEALKEADLIWRCFMRSDLGVRHGRDFLKALHQFGLVELLVGVESGSQVIKDNVHKGTTVEQDTQLRQWCREVGINYKASIILGLPGETMETLEETRAWLLENRPDKVDINVLIPMPGTPLYDRAEEYDCHWTCDAPGEKFFKGKPGELECWVETEALSSQQILDFRNRLVAELEIGY